MPQISDSKQKNLLKESDPKKKEPKTNIFEQKYGHFIALAREAEDDRINKLEALRREQLLLKENATALLATLPRNVQRVDPAIKQELEMIQNRMMSVSKDIREVSEAKDEIPLPEQAGTVTIGSGKNKLEFTENDIERLQSDPDFALERFSALREQGTPGQLEAFSDFVGEQFVNDLATRSAEQDAQEVEAPVTPPTPTVAEVQPAQDQNVIQRTLGTIRSFYEPKTPPGLGVQPTDQIGQDALNQVETQRRQLLSERNQ